MDWAITSSPTKSTRLSNFRVSSFTNPEALSAFAEDEDSTPVWMEDFAAGDGAVSAMGAVSGYVVVSGALNPAFDGG
jgi:hypothetical protein